MQAATWAPSNQDRTSPRRLDVSGTDRGSTMAARWLGLLVLLVAVGVVAMHQLSDGHTLVAPDNQVHGQQAAAAPASVDGTADGGHRLAGPPDSVLEHPIDCGDCGRHAVIAMCLLALLLLLALRPRPRPRAWHPMRLTWTAPARLLDRRPRPGPTPAELCVIRT